MDKITVKLVLTYFLVMVITLILFSCYIINFGIKRAILTSIVISVFAAIVVFVYSYLFTKRIVDFTNKITAMSEGNLYEKLDITGNDEISQLGEAFNELSEKVSVLEKQRTEFVSNASHELKTPLSSIKLMADSIIQTPDIEMD